MANLSDRIVNSVIVTAVARMSMVVALAVIYAVVQLYSSQQATALNSMKQDLTNQIHAAQSPNEN